LTAEPGGPGTSRPAADAQDHAPHRQQGVLAELEDTDVADRKDDGAAVDKFSVGGATDMLGKWFQRLLTAIRQGDAAGTPGTDTSTHRTRGTISRVGLSVSSTATAAVEDAAALGDGARKYPEWDMHRSRYRNDWCTVHEIEPLTDVKQPAAPDDGLHRPLARIRFGLDRCRRQPQGDDIDIDAAIEARIEAMAGSPPSANIYIESQRRKRDLSVLVLLDISGSAAEPDVHGRTVHEQQRAAAAALVSALHHLGDRVALYAYNSRGRAAVQLFPVKRFDEHFSARTMQRLHGLQPGAYSRLGAAMRHGAEVLERRGGTSRRLLLVLSDGLAYDHGYERDYGAADARKALNEARCRGIASLCLTIGGSTNVDSLRRIFGSVAHATIPKASLLVDAVGPLLHSAIRSAEVRRRVSTGNAPIERQDNNHGRR
jgi:nitric oxide reductase activation protein